MTTVAASRLVEADQDAPLTLEEACELVFRGKIKPGTLRKERDRGNLIVERVGRQDFVTIRAINDMRERCRAKQKARGSGSSPSASNKMATSSERSGVSSTTEDLSAAQAAAQTAVEKLRKSCANTSAKSESKTVPATVVPLR